MRPWKAPVGAQAAAAGLLVEVEAGGGVWGVCVVCVVCVVRAGNERAGGGGGFESLRLGQHGGELSGPGFLRFLKRLYAGWTRANKRAKGVWMRRRLSL